jgi:hypothetical protein
MWPLSFLATPFNQFPSKFDILDGGVILKVVYTMRQMIFANGHVIKKVFNGFIFITKTTFGADANFSLVNCILSG